MSRKEINILGVIFCLVFISCQYNTVEYKDYRKYKEENFHKYRDVRSAMRDTLESWIGDSLSSVTQIFYGNPWMVDSVLIFNEDSSRVFTNLLERSHDSKPGTSDNIEDFRGAKIEGVWHFYFGASRILPRSVYQDSVYSPMTFEKISYLSHIKPMARFLKVVGDEYYVDQKEMYKYFIESYPRLKADIEVIDSVILSQIAFNRTRKIPQKEIDRIKLKIENSVKPSEPHNRAGDGKVKLFESEAWKNRNKKK